MSIVTTLGIVTLEDDAAQGIILPHEHVFVDLRTSEVPGFAQAEITDVVALMAPELIKARENGIGLIVESPCCLNGARLYFRNRAPNI
jgi:phosphotriesterase-related protein